MGRVDEWTEGELAVITAAVSRAPSVHNTQPWLLRPACRSMALLERADIALPRHDPLGRDRLISCGAALTNLRLAVRQLGWAEQWAQFPDPARPDVVAAVAVLDRAEPTIAELAAYRSIRARRSHRGPFTPDRVPADLLSVVAHASDVPGVYIRTVREPELPELARVLVHSAAVHRHDRAYQRELAAWTTPGTRTGSGDGLVRAAGHRSLPWAGLVDRHTPLPDREVLACRLATESQLLITTLGDGHGDHLRAGMALERVWLAAVAEGLACSVLTQPLHVTESRAGLIERLELACYPQALLRVGHPAEIVPASPRRPPGTVLRPDEEPAR
ncbi:Acg family FMN-binding oxidoreductase [Actinokineospora enzanensis]|uniref:Acg family FMN-binding oxidoreductase n=1 Tax=Actinokineospora enzanensis TaxID=155975 RepID=UPI0003640212|nr:hypothetical protein [Actinokineospora enzanensis]